MDVREKLVGLLMQVEDNMCDDCGREPVGCAVVAIADHLIAHGVTVGDKQGSTADNLSANGVTVQERARPMEEWGEDYGDVLWWKFPIEEPPYVGSPLDANWPAYHTHWTPIVMPQPPKGE